MVILSTVAKEHLFKDQEIFRTTYFTVAQDWETPIPGFFIISANRELRSWAELNEQEAIDLIKLTVKVRQGMQQVLGIDNVYLFQNEDSAHNFHLWLFPRHKWMNAFGNKIQSVRTIMNYAEQWIRSFDQDIERAKTITSNTNRTE